MQVQPLYYSMKEVCRMLCVSRSTIDRWEADGAFPEREIPLFAKPIHGKQGRRSAFAQLPRSLQTSRHRRRDRRNLEEEILIARPNP
jgi:hypothetical protein